MRITARPEPPARLIHLPPVLQIGLLLAALGLGFLGGQLGWHRPLLTFINALIRKPALAVAAPAHQFDLPTLTLDIKQQNLQILQDRRTVARQTGLTQNGEADRAPATLSIGAQAASVHLWLQEGPAAAFSDTTWPLLIHIRDEASPWGAHDFTLTPAGDNALNTWGYLAALRQAGLPTPRYDLVRLNLNGTDYGLYALEELPGTDFLAAQPAGARIISFNPSDAWNADADLATSFRYAKIELAPATADADRDAAVQLIQQLAAGRDLAQPAFGPDTLGTYLALTALWKGSASLDWHTARFLYDPATRQLTPLATGRDFAPAAPLPETFTADPRLQEAYARALTRYSRPETLDELKAALSPELETLQLAAGPLLGYPDLPWAALEAHQLRLRRLLAPQHPLVAVVTSVSDALTLDVANLQSFPLEIVGLDLGESAFIPADPAWSDPVAPGWIDAPGQLILRGAADELPTSVRLTIPLTAVAGAGSPDQLHIIVRIAGTQTDLPVTVRDIYPAPVSTGARP
jgi:hypothetical protein